MTFKNVLITYAVNTSLSPQEARSDEEGRVCTA